MISAVSSVRPGPAPASVPDLPTKPSIHAGPAPAPDSVDSLGTSRAHSPASPEQYQRAFQFVDWNPTGSNGVTATPADPVTTEAATSGGKTSGPATLAPAPSPTWSTTGTGNGTVSTTAGGTGSGSGHGDVTRDFARPRTITVPMRLIWPTLPGGANPAGLSQEQRDRMDLQRKEATDKLNAWIERMERRGFTVIVPRAGIDYPMPA